VSGRDRTSQQAPFLTALFMQCSLMPGACSRL
jgi:hypothetical protein